MVIPGFDLPNEHAFDRRLRFPRVLAKTNEGASHEQKKSEGVVGTSTHARSNA